MTTQRHVVAAADFGPRLAAARRVLREREADCAIVMGPEAQ
jgi:hypothetical protein